MPVSVAQPSISKQEDPLDKIQKALQIAGTIHGWGENAKKAEQAAELAGQERMLKQQQLDAIERQKKGILLPGEIAKFASEGGQFVETAGLRAPPQGSFLVKVAEENPDIEGGVAFREGYLVPPKKEAERDSELKQLQTAKLREELSPVAKNRKLEADLRDEYKRDPTTKSTDIIMSAYKKASKAFEGTSSADDLALIYHFAKIMDPNSAVKEGEINFAQSTNPVVKQLETWWNQARRGKTALPQEVRQNLFASIQSTAEAQLENQKEIDSQYSALAGQSGINPKNVLVRSGLDFKRKEFGPQEQPEVAQAGVMPRGTPPPKRMSSDDIAAINWAKANAKDPRAAQILKMHGVR